MTTSTDECKGCDGTGYFYYRSWPYTDILRKEVCSVCNGTGKVEESPPVNDLCEFDMWWNNVSLKVIKAFHEHGGCDVSYIAFAKCEKCENFERQESSEMCNCSTKKILVCENILMYGCRLE
jgi:RecJ-like exonuclease